MTCIAYRDGIMAADKQSTFGSLVMRTTKLHRADAWVVGGCGATARIHEIHEWISDGMDPGALPAFQRTDDLSVTMLLASSSGVYYMDASHVLIPIEQPFFACGQGRDFAMAAMHMGATASEAVEVANIYCSSCGLGVDTMKVPGWKRQRGGVTSQ